MSFRTLFLIFYCHLQSCIRASVERWSYKSVNSTSPRRFDGIQINLLFPDFIAHGQDGHGSYFVDYIKSFCDETGASATMTQKEFPVAYRKELEYDLDSGLNFYDAFNFFGSWMPRLVENGDHLLKLTSYVKRTPSIAWSDILPAVRRGVCEYEKEIYMLPADGDVIVMIYRKDLLDYHGLAKPETWEDWLAVSNYFRTNVGTAAWVDSPDRALSQEGGSGACMMTKLGDWAYASLFAYLSTILQAHGPSQGVFFDPVTMEPFLKSGAAREALTFYKQMVKASTHADRPCVDCDDDGGAGLKAMIEDMQAGKCMMGINYMGPLKSIANGTFNKANSTIALAPVPGTTRVKAFHGDELVECTKSESTCPHATEVPKNVNGRAPMNGETHRVNRATYYSGGGQSWAISNNIKSERKVEALWEFFKGLVDRKHAILSTADADYFLDPFRQSTLDDLQVQGTVATVKFLENGWKWDQLGTMKHTLDAAFNDPNGVLDLKIVDGDSYIEDTDMPMLKYFNDELTVDEAIDEITAKWTRRTQTHGFRQQRALYRKVLGLKPYFDKSDCADGTQWVQGACLHTGGNEADPAIIALTVVLVLIFVALVVRLMSRRCNRSVQRSFDSLYEAVANEDSVLVLHMSQRLRMHGFSSQFVEDEIWRIQKKVSLEAGVSLSYLFSAEFQKIAQEATGSKDPTFLDMQEPFFFGPNAIGCNTPCPRDRREGCALIDTLPKQYRKTATHFVSWVWSYPLSTVISALRYWVELEGLDPDDIFLHMCFFVNNQYRILVTKETIGSDSLDHVFENHLQRIGRMVALIDTWEDPIYLRRIWTIFEQFIACKLDLPVTMILPPAAADSLLDQFNKGKEGILSVRDSLSTISSEHAQATLLGDEQKVKARIRETIGFQSVDEKVAETMLRWVGATMETYMKTLLKKTKASSNAKILTVAF